MSNNCLAQTDLCLPWNSIPHCKDTVGKATKKLENDNDFLLNLVVNHLCGAVSMHITLQPFSDFPTLRKCSLLNKVIHVTGRSIQCRATFKLWIY